MASLMNRGYLPFIIGGLLLGSGLDLAGTCPGMIFVEVILAYSVLLLAWCFCKKQLVDIPWLLCWYVPVYPLATSY